MPWRKGGVDLPGWRPLFDKADRPGPGLLERLGGCDAAVLLDAMHAGGEAGAVRQVERRELATADRLFSGHALGVAEALALGERLGLLPQRLYIVGIEMGGGLPPASVDRAVALIKGWFD